MFDLLIVDLLTNDGLVSETMGMTKRLQILLDEAEYREIQRIARRQRLTLAEWVRRALHRARSDAPGTVDSKLRVIAEASCHSFPTADIEVMLREIEPDQNLP